MAKKARKTVEERIKELEALDIAEKWDELNVKASQFIQEWPAIGIGYFFLGKAKSSRGRYSEAIKDYDKALKIDPSEPEVFYQRLRTILEEQTQEIKTGLDNINERTRKDYELQLQDIRNPLQIGNYYYQEVTRIRRLLFGIDESPKTSEQDRAFSAIDMLRWTYWFYAHKSKKPLILPVSVALFTLWLLYYLDILQNISCPRTFFCFILPSFIPTLLLGLPLLHRRSKHSDTIEKPAPIIGRFNIGLTGAADRASARYRIIIICLWLLLATGFYKFLFAPKGDIAILMLLSFTGSIILLSLPPLLHVRHLNRRVSEETVRLHSLMRERNAILFWQAQTDDVKAKLAPEFLEYMNTKGTADMSLQMMFQLGFRRKNSKEEPDLAEALKDIAKAIKDISPLKPD